MGILDMAMKLALAKIQNDFINARLAGIGKVRDLVWKDKKLSGVLELAGLEDSPITIQAEGINIADNGSSIIVSAFDSNMPFARTALNRNLAGKPLPVPEGKARIAALGAKKVLGL